VNMYSFLYSLPFLVFPSASNFGARQPSSGMVESDQTYVKYNDVLRLDNIQWGLELKRPRFNKCVRGNRRV
jgi:hypothetical protein